MITIRIGNRIFNLEHVTVVDVTSKGVDIHTSDGEWWFFKKDDEYWAEATRFYDWYKGQAKSFWEPAPTGDEHKTQS